MAEPSNADQAAPEPTKTPVANASGSPAPVLSPVPKAAPSALDRAPQPGARRPGGATRPFLTNKVPKGDRPPNPGGKPQLLDKKGFVGAKPNNRELDKLIEDEMNQAMAGFDVTR